MKDEGASLVITVDCGAAAIAALTAARDAGLDVVVLDHHAVETPPPAVAHVNPNQPGDTSGLGYLCAAGVTFLFLVALNRALARERLLRGEAASPSPICAIMLDLVGLATICDVVPLIGVNRAFVRAGLAQLAKLSRPGLAALAAVAKAAPPFTPYHLGFVFGPRINAGGRVGRCSPGRRSADRDATAAGATNSPRSSTCTIASARRSRRLILEEAIAHGRDPGQCAVPARGRARAGIPAWSASSPDA